MQSFNQFFCDVVVEELLPLAAWGSSYFVVPLATRTSDTVRVLSSDNDNLVTVANSGGSSSFTLARGQHKDLVLDLATRITCRRPALVAQFSNSSDADHVAYADPFMALVQPAMSWLQQYRLCTPPQGQFESNHVNLVAGSLAAVNAIRVNGTAVSALPAGTVTTGTFSTGQGFARVRLQPGTTYLINSAAAGIAGGPVPFGLTAYGFSEFDSYGYPGGMTFDDLQGPLISCPAEVTIRCTGTGPDCVVDAPNLIALSEFFDNCTPGAQLTITQSPRAGEALRLGNYQVTISATDANGNRSTCITRLIVQPMWEEARFGAQTVANTP